MTGTSSFTAKEAMERVKRWQSEGEKIVFTNGVFDILHRGHVTYLNAARSLGNRLIVGLNADASVRRLNKGPERPIHDQLARAIVLSALRCVDAVVIFEEDTPLELIEALNPDILVKGGDYDPEETNTASPRYMVGSRETKLRGGEVHSIPIVEGYSTTKAIEKLKGK
jgi:rfaE bifunctional protein nucleotidyltransferase chain/domain